MKTIEKPKSSPIPSVPISPSQNTPVPTAPPSEGNTPFHRLTPQEQNARIQASFAADKIKQTVIMLQNQDPKSCKKFLQLCKEDQESISQLYNKDDPNNLTNIQHVLRIAVIAPKETKIKEMEERLSSWSDRSKFDLLTEDPKYEVATLYWRDDIAERLDMEIENPAKVNATRDLFREAMDFLEKYKSYRFLIYSLSSRKQKLINDMRPKINDYFKKVKTPPIDEDFAYKYTFLQKVKAIVDKYPAPKTDHTGNEETIPTSEPAEESTAPASANSRDAVPAEIMGANHSDSLFYDYFSPKDPKYQKMAKHFNSEKLNIMLGILYRINDVEIWERFLTLDARQYKWLIFVLNFNECTDHSTVPQRILTHIAEQINGFYNTP